MFTWPVKTCGSPTAFVSVSGEIWMFASTHVLTAFGRVAGVRVAGGARDASGHATTTVVEALTVVTPGVEEFRVTVHDPVVPIVVQLAGVSVPGPLTIEKLIVVPAGALTKPVPSSTFTWPV